MMDCADWPLLALQRACFVRYTWVDQDGLGGIGAHLVREFDPVGIRADVTLRANIAGLFIRCVLVGRPDEVVWRFAVLDPLDERQEDVVVGIILEWPRAGGIRLATATKVPRPLPATTVRHTGNVKVAIGPSSALASFEASLPCIHMVVRASVSRSLDSLACQCRGNFRPFIVQESASKPASTCFIRDQRKMGKENGQVQGQPIET